MRQFSCCAAANAQSTASSNPPAPASSGNACLKTTGRKAYEPERQASAADSASFHSRRGSSRKPQKAMSGASSNSNAGVSLTALKVPQGPCRNRAAIPLSVLCSKAEPAAIHTPKTPGAPESPPTTCTQTTSTSRGKHANSMCGKSG
ncbi:hypothetical protein cyc_02691 [Cyclospora cayetanensis]|uniref:Uncharacterized protein n=1 Tax=Cyclospora cayetanensis TaxID=88456 RepID=A0A1D3D736_9EIME|nr:hypothetical protein cyc_02691 [Cyclospora cayetanensis]